MSQEQHDDEITYYSKPDSLQSILNTKNIRRSDSFASIKSSLNRSSNVAQRRKLTVSQDPSQSSSSASIYERRKETRTKPIGIDISDFDIMDTLFPKSFASLSPNREVLNQYLVEHIVTEQNNTMSHKLFEMEREMDQMKVEYEKLQHEYLMILQTENQRINQIQRINQSYGEVEERLNKKEQKVMELENLIAKSQGKPKKDKKKFSDKRSTIQIKSSKISKTGKTNTVQIPTEPVKTPEKEKEPSQERQWNVESGFVLGEELYAYPMSKLYNSSYEGEAVTCKVVPIEGSELSDEDESILKKLVKLSDYPNMITIIGVSLKNRLTFINEDCSGGYLRNYLSGGGSVNWELFFSWSMTLFKCLSYLHSNDIFHKDINPENILVKGLVLKLGECKIPKLVTRDYIDFGNFGGRFKDNYISCAYMAPEIVDQKYSATSDVYRFY
eukprot:TRINITY_DN4862_c0_g1_i3.p1 TRINITY_DN4862_c0_g1~~TRINITY_DN4862_c0_g1_i3.p1  ORF type:complete len:442 (+),score=80.33 TRINITY_DN4862_c0_g1_i3:20-1345(+)